MARGSEAERAFAELQRRSKSLQDFRKDAIPFSLRRSPRDAAAVGRDALYAEGQQAHSRLNASLAYSLPDLDASAASSEGAAALARAIAPLFDCDDALAVLDHLLLTSQLHETHPEALLEAALPSHGSSRFLAVAKALKQGSSPPSYPLGSFIVSCAENNALPPRRTVAAAFARSSAAIRWALGCLSRSSVYSSSISSFFATVTAEALALSSSGAEAAVLSFVSRLLESNDPDFSLIPAAALLAGQLAATRRLSLPNASALASTLVSSALSACFASNRKMQAQLLQAAALICRAQGVHQMELPRFSNNDTVDQHVQRQDGVFERLTSCIEECVAKVHTPAASRELSEAVARTAIARLASASHNEASHDACIGVCTTLVASCGARGYTVIRYALTPPHAGSATQYSKIDEARLTKDTLSELVASCHEHDRAGVEAALAQAGRTEQLASLPGAWAAGKPVSAAVSSESIEERLAAAKASVDASFRLISDADATVAAQAIDTVMSANGVHGLALCEGRAISRLLLAAYRCEKKLALSLGSLLAQLHRPESTFAVIEAIATCSSAKLAARLARAFAGGSDGDASAAKKAKKNRSCQESTMHADIASVLDSEALANVAETARARGKAKAAVLIAHAARCNQKASLHQQWTTARAALLTASSCDTASTINYDDDDHSHQQQQNKSNLTELISALAKRLEAENDDLELVEKMLAETPPKHAGELWKTVSCAIPCAAALALSSLSPTDVATFFVHTDSALAGVPYSLAGSLNALLQPSFQSERLDDALSVLQALGAEKKLVTLLQRQHPALDEEKLASKVGTSAALRPHFKALVTFALSDPRTQSGPAKAQHRSFSLRMCRFCGDEIAETARNLIRPGMVKSPQKTRRRSQKPSEAVQEQHQLKPGSADPRELTADSVDAVIALCGVSFARTLLAEHEPQNISDNSFVRASLHLLAEHGWSKPSEVELNACCALMPLEDAKRALQAVLNVPSSAVRSLMMSGTTQAASVLASLEHFEGALDGGKGIRCLSEALCRLIEHHKDSSRHDVQRTDEEDRGNDKDDSDVPRQSEVLDLRVALRVLHRCAIAQAYAAEDINRALQIFLSVGTVEQSIERLEAIASVLEAAEPSSNSPECSTGPSNVNLQADQLGLLCAQAATHAGFSRRAKRALVLALENSRSVSACVAAVANSQDTIKAQMANTVGHAVGTKGHLEALIHESVQYGTSPEIIARIASACGFASAIMAIAKLIPKEEVAENNRASAGAVGLAVLANFSPDPAELDESAVESLEMLARAALEANAELCVQASILAGPAATVEQAVESCLTTSKNGGSLKGISNASSVLTRCGCVDMRTLRAVTRAVSQRQVKQIAKFASQAVRLVSTIDVLEESNSSTIEAAHQAQQVVGEELLPAVTEAANACANERWARCISECINAAGLEALPSIPLAANALQRCVERRDKDALGALSQALRALGPYFGPHARELVLALARAGAASSVKELCGQVSLRMSASALTEAFAATEDEAQRVVLLEGLRAAANAASRQDIVTERRSAFSLVLKALASEKSQIGRVSEAACEAATELAVKLSESEFRPVFVRIVEWSRAFQSRRRPLVQLAHHLVNRLRSVFVPYFAFVLDSACGLLSVELEQQQQSGVKRQRMGLQADDDHSATRAEAANALAACFSYDTVSFATDDRVKYVAESAIVAARDVPDRVEHLIRQVAAAISTPGAKQTLHRNALALAKSSKNSTERRAGTRSLIAMVEELEEEYLPLVPEAVPFVAELLEDPNADVVQEARRLAQMLSRLTGEELTSLIESGGEDAASEATAPSKKQQLENGDQGDRSEDGESEDANRDDEGDDSE